MTVKFFPIFFGVGFMVASCSSPPWFTSKAKLLAIEKTSAKKRFLNYPSSSKILWINRIPQSLRYKFYVGRSANAKSQENGILLATQDAYRQSIRENFGIKVRVNTKLLETLKKTIYSKEIQEVSNEIKLTGFERRKIHIEKKGETFYVWVLFRYSLKEIEREKERIKNQKTNLIKGISEYWAGNDDKAIKFFGYACADNVLRACLFKAKLEYDRGNTVKAERLWQGACDVGEAGGCINLGLIEEDRGNTAKAARLYQKACVGIRGTALLGCTMLGIIEYNRGNTSRAARLFKKACDGEELLGCSRSGILEYKKGNIDKAARLLQKACDGMLSCSRLGGLEFQRGNISKAVKIWKKACDDMEDSDACDFLKEGEEAGFF